MKRKLLFAALLFASVTTMAQTPRKDSAVTALKEKHYFLVLTESDWLNLFAVIRTSDVLSAKQAEDRINYYNSLLRELPDVADTAKKKK